MTVQSGFQASGWLGALAGTHKSYPMHDPSRIAEASVALIADLRQRTQPAPADEPSEDSAASLVDEWTTADVTSWLTRVGVSRSVLTKWARLGMDGKALRGLALLRKDHCLGTTLREDLSVRNPLDLLHIVRELDSLV